ncbi:hypothetical protein [Arthrobacter cavernae]|uniref:Uncharacterized protein n=1 Tax=Arthrobacter cavernae TaxID=2817681 RepID=A0A939HGF9_9MICC|nr:hypothetical protein [Arthrobacter cavernae]MBO1269466.1 hypothetical protein [Arthrobacter cavernae]
MQVEKATLADVWPLAWTVSLAFSSESTRPMLRLRAALGYCRHLVYLVPAALDGCLWHSNRRMAMGIESGKPGRSRSTWLLAVTVVPMLGAVASLGLADPGTRQEAQRVVAVLNTSMVILATVFAVCAVAIVRSRPIRHAKAYSAITAWKRDLHPAQPYTIAYLAKHPEEDPGAGFRFAKADLAAVVPAGSPLCTTARTSRHIRAYQAAGFTQLLMRA